jgi:hypothetical protein
MKNPISRIILLALAAAALAPTVAHAQPFSTNYWVTANYIAVLGRNPDPAGWVYYTGAGIGQTQLTVDFLASGEYCGFFGQPANCTNPPDNSQFLALLYQNALGRAPDPTGWTSYLGQLASGVSPAQIVYDFISSQEFSTLYGAYCTSYFPGYATPLAYSTTASAVGGTTTAFTVTYASPSGTSDIVSGQVQFDSATGCYAEWSGPISAPTFWLNGTSAGCSLNPGSSIASVPGNPRSIAVTFMLTFSEQNFVGTHQVTAWGLDAENLETPPQTLGSFVVTQGQDFTLSVTPGDPTLFTTVPLGQSVTLTVTSTGLNGFTGANAITLGIATGQYSTNGNCFDSYGLPGVMGATDQVTFTLTNNYCASGAYEQVIITGTAQSVGVSHSSSNTWLLAGSGLDFSVTVGPASSPTLTSQTPVSYPVTVTSVNNDSGTVNLNVVAAQGASWPAGVTFGFSPASVYLPAGGTATSTLTLSGSASTPGGTSPLVVTGALGSVQHTAASSLGTQVTTVTSTPTAVLNGGQSVQVPITLSLNAPPISSCGVLLSDGAVDTTGLTGVTCQPGGSGYVTVTATAQTQHGTYVIALNGGAVQFHVAIADNSPGSPSGEYSVTAGQTATFTIDSPGPDDLYTDGTAVPYLNGGYVRWAYVDSVLPNSVTVTLSPPASVQPGNYTLDVNLCGCFFNTSERDGGGPDICEVVAPIEVDSPPAPSAMIAYPGVTLRNPTVVSVGQLISLVGSVENLDAGVTVTSQSWSVTGNPILAYSPTYQGAQAPVNFTNTGTDQASFYWTNTDNQTAYTVTYTAALSSGPPVSTAANFLVIKPSPRALTSGPFSTVAAPTVNGVPYLTFGSLGTSEAGSPNNGINFNVSAGTSFGGQFCLFQLIQFTNTYTPQGGGPPTTTTSNNNFVLDDGGNESPVFALVTQTAPASSSFDAPFAYDSPFIAVANPGNLASMSASQSFQTYLMYMPPAIAGCAPTSAFPCAIWVALQEMSWSWSGTATLSNGSWGLATSPPATAPTQGSAPTGADLATPPQPAMPPTWTTYATKITKGQ